ncbi:hypothetical protein Fmac_030370 [Flemingia macrophylla]|uniref:Protein APEM9 n=1 Tax=Flemingia macrophylla TaxID=520843 RepID=A0ABD1LCZ6_9FABA
MEIETESDDVIWKQIADSESYLVCAMYEDAASLASSILERLRYADDYRGLETRDMLESTAMVLLQALHLLGRTPEIFNQLRLYFISVKAIPPLVLLTGVCFHIAQGSMLGVQEFIEEFLNRWSLEGAQYCAVITETNVEGESRDTRRFVLETDEYLEVVEFYAVTILATGLKDVELAISWVENASLPEENRQELLRRLHSMHSPKSSSLSQISSPSPPTISNEQIVSEKNEENKSKEAVPKLSERVEACFWCFRAVNLKIGSAKFVITSRRILLGCLIVFIYYVFRKKRATIQRTVRRQMTAVKRALVDLWQLAFSYQVNPLAAVQPLSAAARQGQ